MCESEGIELPSLTNYSNNIDNNKNNNSNAPSPSHAQEKKREIVGHIIEKNIEKGE